jgi:catechol 2,3-dioxygenase-like lactoylglutathione lyase family enzyme
MIVVSAMVPNDILETCLCVTDLDAAEQFYRRALGLEFVSRQAGRHVFLRLGQRMFLLFNAAESELPQGGFPPHGTRGPGHVCFTCREEEIDAWRQHLETCGVAIEHVHTWPGGVRSLYFRDPSGNSVELASPRIWGLPE